MKHNNFQVEGEIVKQDERYVVIDNKELSNLVLSSTLLHPDKSTSGHQHAGQEEVYFFASGTGTMQLDDEHFPVKAGDIIQIKDNVFHRVFNNSGTEDLYFVCVFDGRRNH